MSDFDRQVLRQLKTQARDLNRDNNQVYGPSLGELYGTFLGLPNLHAFWPLSTNNGNGDTTDLSGWGQTLSGVAYPGTGVLNSLLPYYTYNGSTQCHSRAGTDAQVNSAWATGLTLGAWVYCNNFTNAGLGAPIMGKMTTAGNLRQYWLQFTVGGGAALHVSTDGTAEVTATAPNSLTTGTWHFIVGRFTPSSEVAVLVDDTKTANAVGVPATLKTTTTPAFALAMIDNSTRWLEGRLALAFLCAAALTATQLTYLYRRSYWIFNL